MHENNDFTYSLIHFSGAFDRLKVCNMVDLWYERTSQNSSQCLNPLRFTSSLTAHVVSRRKGEPYIPAMNMWLVCTNILTISYHQMAVSAHIADHH